MITLEIIDLITFAALFTTVGFLIGVIVQFWITGGFKK